MDIDPRLLRVFATVLRAGSLTRAAEELNTTQPSISKAVKRLENLVGFPIFEKRGRRLFPTAEAMLISDDVKHMERELEAIRRKLSDIRRGRHLGFSVAALPAFANTLLPRAIAQLRRQHPQATMKIEIWRRSLILSEFDAGRIDIGLIHWVSEAPPAGFEVVANRPICCLIPKSHPLRARDTIHACDLSGEKLVIYHNSLDFADALWRVLDDLEPMPEIVVEASHSALLRDLVKEGVGIALVDGFTADDAGITGVEVRRFEPEIPFSLAVAHRRPTLSADAQVFLNIIKEIAG